ncbi:MAG: hypothetical protein K0S74_1729 [Chlamydiales bacterium]|jgi:general secretion pathway protein D|nr:hypothetical protein [Chlamydiales bacterium]
MPYKQIYLLYSFFIVISCMPGSAFTQEFKEELEEIRSSNLEQIQSLDQQLEMAYDSLRTLQKHAASVYSSEKKLEDFKKILKEINQVREQIENLQNEQGKLYNILNEKMEPYSLWNHSEISLEKLIVEYSSKEFIYLIPENLSHISIKIIGNTPILRSNCSEVLEWVLAQNGIGVKILNSCTKQLFMVQGNKPSIQYITDNIEFLESLPSHSRVCFVINPDLNLWNNVYHTLKEFHHPAQISLYSFGQQIYIAGHLESIQEVLKIYNFICDHKIDLEYQLVVLNKIQAVDIEPIIQSICCQGLAANKGEATKYTESHPQLQIYKFKQNSHILCLVGPKQAIKQAQIIIQNLESNFSDYRKQSIFWYTCKHSDPQELALILEKIYALMAKSNDTIKDNKESKIDRDSTIETTESTAQTSHTHLVSLDQKGLGSVIPVATPTKDLNLIWPPKKETTRSKPGKTELSQFVVDPKTGSIVTIVEGSYLDSLIEIAQRLDTPKKMVQIDVLLVEKHITKSSSIGLNLLQLGGSVKHQSSTISWKEVGDPKKGILEFITAHAKHGKMPAYSLAYQFLLAQDDIQVNANPSVITINQTPAKISIVDERSIDMGASQSSKNRTSQIYARAEYGINLKITPTVHLIEGVELEQGYKPHITLKTEIDFETVHNKSSQPLVTKRRIQNEVRIAHGETVILGGLRTKSRNDSKQSIPLLGDIPGLGKFFSNQELSNESKEMFIFLTPKIIEDNADDRQQLMQEQLQKRPGDTPLFLKELEAAQQREKRRQIYDSLKFLFAP